MAHLLSLMYGSGYGSGINFLNECGTSPWCHISDGGLIISTPSKKQTWAGASFWRDGTELTMHAYQNRKIELDFEIGGTSRDNIFDMVVSINRVLEDARQSQLNGMAYPVQLKYQVNSVTNPIYFDVLDGDLDIPENIMSVESLGWSKCGGHYTMKGCTLTLICKPFGRGDIVTLVNGTSIQNEDGAATNNYVTWSASAVDGDVPGPLKIRFKNTTSGIKMVDFYVGLRDIGTVASCKLVYEIEAGTRTGSPSLSSNTAYSGGEAYVFTLSSLGTDGDKIVSWTETAQTSSINRKGKFRAVLVSSASSGILYQLRTYFGGTGVTEMSRTAWVKPVDTTPGFVDLGVVDLPPWPVGVGDSYEEYLIQLFVKGADGGDSGTCTLDAVYLFPANDYKYRFWRFMGYNLEYLYYVEDDGRNNKISEKNTALTYAAYILRYKGLPIHARPNSDGKLSFLWLNENGNYNADYTADVYVYHEPYYLHVRGTS